MTKKEYLQKNILNSLSTVLVASTVQVESFFQDTGSPKKRASEFLRELEADKLVEGKMIRIGKPKIWRLSRQGRLNLGIERRPIPFNSAKMDHFLKIGDVYFELFHKGGLKNFQCEIRESFLSKINKKNVFYSPDAFFHFRNDLYLIEVQRTPISTKRWREKWKISEEFFYDGHYEKINWHSFDKKYIPQILVLSNQSEKVVKAGSDLPITVIRKITDII